MVTHFVVGETNTTNGFVVLDIGDGKRGTFGVAWGYHEGRSAYRVYGPEGDEVIVHDSGEPGSADANKYPCTCRDYAEHGDCLHAAAVQIMDENSPLAQGYGWRFPQSVAEKVSA